MHEFIFAAAAGVIFNKNVHGQVFTYSNIDGKYSRKVQVP